MLRNTVVFPMIFYMVSGQLNNFTTTKPKVDCSLVHRTAVTLRTECIDETVQLITHNTTLPKKPDVCRSSLDIENRFYSTFKTVIVCHTEKISRELMHNSSIARTYLINQTFAGTKLKEFFDNGGVQCIKSNGNAIFDRCVRNIGGYSKPFANLNHTISRFRLLFFSGPTCSRRNDVMNCTRLILTNNCHKSSVDFLMYLNDALNAYCNSTRVVPHLGASPRKSYTAIIIGTIAAILLLGIIGLLLFQKLRKRKTSTQMYNVDFHSSKVQ